MEALSGLSGVLLRASQGLATFVMQDDDSSYSNQPGRAEASELEILVVAGGGVARADVSPQPRSDQTAHRTCTPKLTNSKRASSKETKPGDGL